MKVILMRSDGSAKQLIEQLKQSGLYDDLPESIKSGISDQVLCSLPFLRNRLGGHGQGESVIDIPDDIARLALHLSGSFIVFLMDRYVNKYAKQSESQETESVNASDDDDVPF